MAAPASLPAISPLNAEATPHTMIFATVDVTFWTYFFLVVALGLALGFEFVNGFHDTANAVATVIYTNTLPSWMAVVWSGIWNLIGVLLSSGAVAFGIIALLPVELVLNVGSSAGFAMVFALLLSAITWNLGTWYLGLPASSSHTLIGAIMGVGLANSLLTKGSHFGEGVNWQKAQDVGLALLVSPVVGFVVAGLLLLLAKALIRNPALYTAPEGKQPPPWPIRLLLIGTCTGVSYAHGSNDGQKGMGLIMLILIGILPATYALRMNADPQDVTAISTLSAQLEPAFTAQAAGAKSEDPNTDISNYLKGRTDLTPQVYAALATTAADVNKTLGAATEFNNVPAEQRRELRTDLYLISSATAKLSKARAFATPALEADAKKFSAAADHLTKHIPDWVKIATAFALGLGTMVGWKRIVVTVGEKIGKSHLTYAQGASAELVAMCTILAADKFGLPVSTTHILSSGVAGTMAANKSGLQADTLRNILLAWVLTLPVCVFLGALLFALGLNVILWLGLK
jgi:PiT family inorganic phosphate transporter